MALGVFGFGCEDALVHLMNSVWPNIFETAPHMMQSFHDAVDGLRVSVGPIKVLLYTLQVSYSWLCNSVNSSNIILVGVPTGLENLTMYY